MIKEELDGKIKEFEEFSQRVASDVARGFLCEKLHPSELLKKTQPYVDRLVDLATSSEELMLILKPEKASTIKLMCKSLTQTLKTFKDILVQNTPDPLANSRLAFEQLRKALTDGSDFLFLMREVRDNPSPLLDALLNLKNASEAKNSVTSTQAGEDIQPPIKYVLSRLDEFRAGLTDLEKKVDEMKQFAQELQRENLKPLSDKASAQPTAPGNRTEKKQLSISNFKTEEN